MPDPVTLLSMMADLRADRDQWWQATAREGEIDMRRLASARGLDRDALSEAQREDFVESVLHEP